MFQYNYVKLDTVDGTVVDQLNNYGQKGWRVVAFIPSPHRPGVYQVLLERPVFN